VFVRRLDSSTCSLVRSFVRQILSSQYLMNGLSNLDETYRKYLLAPNDDLIRFLRSKVKVTAGSHSRWWKHSCQCWGVEFYLLVMSSDV